MNDEVAHPLAEDFARALDLKDTHEDRGTHGMILHALRSLPQPDSLIFHSNQGLDARPVALLLSGNRLLDVRAGSREKGGDGPPCVTVISHALRDSRARIELEWGDRQTTDTGVYYRTAWMFRFPDGEAVCVVGEVTTMPEALAGIDEGEKFARAVAERLGQSAE